MVRRPTGLGTSLRQIRLGSLFLALAATPVTLLFLGRQIPILLHAKVGLAGFLVGANAGSDFEAVCRSPASSGCRARSCEKPIRAHDAVAGVIQGYEAQGVV